MLKLTTTLIISLALSLVSTFSFAQVTADFTVDKANVCDGYATVVYTDNSSSGADDWTWTFTNGTPSSGTGKGPHVVTYAPGAPLGAQSVTLEVQDKSKLPSVVTNTKTQSLTNINAVPVITNTFLEQAVTICSGSKTGLILKSDQANTVFTWSLPTVTGSITGVIAGTTTAPGAKIDQALIGYGVVNYVVTPELGGCSGTPVNYLVTVNSLPFLTAIGSTYCKNTQSTITLNVLWGQPPYTFQWSATPINPQVTGQVNSVGFVSATDIKQTLTTEASTNQNQVYAIDIKDANGCIGTSIATLVVAPCPFKADFSLNADAACLDATTNDAKVSVTPKAVAGIKWTWNLGTPEDYTTTLASLTDNGSNGTSMNAPSTAGFEVTYKSAGVKTITLTVTGPNGSSTNTYSKTFSVESRPTLTVPIKSANICSGTSANLAVTTSFPTIISWLLPVATQSITGGAAYTSEVNESSTTINQILTNPNAPGTVTYQVVAGTTGCQSPSETVVVTVDKCINGIHKDEVISSMFPNPTTDLVNISLTNTYNGNVNLFDSKGSKVFSVGFFGDKVTLSTIDLPNGLYMVLIDTTTGFKAKQLLMINK